MADTQAMKAQSYWELCNSRVAAATDRRDKALNELISAQADLRQWSGAAAEALQELGDEVLEERGRPLASGPLVDFGDADDQAETFAHYVVEGGEV